MLTAISPIDGRYQRHTKPLQHYFSEYALIQARVRVEIEYFIALCAVSKTDLPQLPELSETQVIYLRKIYNDFSLEEAKKIKETENITNHDVKAVEYFVKEALEKLDLGIYNEFVHFGLTSQDINNTANPILLKEAEEKVIFDEINQIIEKLHAISEEWKDIPLLAHTHGQPASPTHLGKEIRVFEYRLKKQFEHLQSIPNTGKFGGATGNFNAHKIAYPKTDWKKFGKDFLAKHLGLERQELTTQIDNYDFLAAKLDAYKRINTILIDFSRDIWTYISMGYFKQKINPNEVGSSAMPHKVNPIDFENAEGNLGISTALFEHLATKLPISRLQRDLTDSTVLRNLGVPFGHLLIAFKSLQKGIGKLEVNETKIAADLENNWAVVAEAIQTILRREKYPKPYEALKALTRTGKTMNQETIQEFIKSLEVSDEVKNELLDITPFNFTGYK
ncbi:adenylosuccinate lyase [Bernardetia sp.]|uniref:adenylosuccinate lyase n=1 Tax=Bernardetia sp. TaxID=1937974 RepID=UPI0025C29FE1|nr:adenylosuccinate lyase [Bernardetia sp.]